MVHVRPVVHEKVIPAGLLVPKAVPTEGNTLKATSDWRPGEQGDTE